MLRLSSLHAPMKFVPRSDLSVLMGPLMAVKRLRPLMKLEVVMVSITSMCTALVLRQVKMTAHRLFSAWPPLVLREVTVHGPNTSNPTCVNGGSTESLSEGKSDIFCSSSFPLNRLHMTHLCITLETSRFPPISHSPADLTAPSVKWRPWCATCSW